MYVRGATSAKPAGFPYGLSQNEGRRKPCRFSAGRTSYVCMVDSRQLVPGSRLQSV